MQSCYLVTYLLLRSLDSNTKVTYMNYHIPCCFILLSLLFICTYLIGSDIYCTALGHYIVIEYMLKHVVLIYLPKQSYRLASFIQVYH